VLKAMTMMKIPKTTAMMTTTMMMMKKKSRLSRYG
jgi:hypothetical protein